MYTSSITQKGQITIPAPLRDKLALHTGDKVEVISEGDKIIIMKLKNDITAAFGLYQVAHKVSLEDIQSAIEKGPLDDSN